MRPKLVELLRQFEADADTIGDALTNRVDEIYKVALQEGYVEDAAERDETRAIAKRLRERFDAEGLVANVFFVIACQQDTPARPARPRAA